MAQVAVTVMNMVHWSFGVNASYPGCQSQISSAHSDTLVGTSFGHMNRGKTWATWTKAFKPDIIVMSMGAHLTYKPDWQLNFTWALQKIATKHQMHYPRVPLIWKTQPPAGCGPTSLPAGPGRVDEENNSKRLKYLQASYNWATLIEMDRIAQKFWAKQPGARVLDLTPLYYRVEAHPGSPGAVSGTTKTMAKDCMHVCDGPLRLAAVLLLNMLITDNL